MHTHWLAAVVSRIALVWLALVAAALPIGAQTPPAPGTALQPITPIALAELLARPLAGPVTAPRTVGDLDLKRKRFYIADYRVLVDQGGELRTRTRDGQLLGTASKTDDVTLAYRTQPDLGMLQALVDRAWADLQARLAAAGVLVEPGDDIISANDAVFAATAAPTLPDLPPVMAEGKSGDNTRRYLVLAPSGQRLVPQAPGGLDPGNLTARVKYLSSRVEGLSLALAVNLSGLDLAAQRPSTYPAPEGAPTLSPLMELVPAPGVALVHAHAQSARVNLAEALVLAPEFARLRPADGTDKGERKTALDKLLALGRSITSSGRPRVDAALDLDGPSTARLLMYALSAGNQAITDALKAAQ